MLIDKEDTFGKKLFGRKDCATVLQHSGVFVLCCLAIWFVIAFFL